MRKFAVFTLILFVCLSPSAHAFEDISASLSLDELQDIKTTVSACADIMSFDIKHYDYDTLFKYVLYTHENFRVVTDISPDTQKSSTTGYKITLVKDEFVDYIMADIFRIAPEKPPVSDLTGRGFCYNNGYYMYTGGFDVYFATDVNEPEAIFDLGGAVYLVTFTDIYREENSEVFEQSFAILQKNTSGYSLLRLGMGEEIPSEEELISYVPAEAEPAGDTKNGDIKAYWLIGVLLGVFTFSLFCVKIFAGKRGR